jgi:kynurenine formamidase
MSRIFDLSLPLLDGATEPNPPKIVHSSHEAGTARLAKIAGIEAEDFPGNMALATDMISLVTHNGTHVDAPYHYGKVSGGKPAQTIDQVPLSWCIGDGVVIDVRHKKPGEEITVADMQACLDAMGYSIKEGDIVLLQTGCDQYWGTDTATYMKMQSGLGLDGLKWLLDKGVKTIGIDAWTLDRPVYAMVEDFHKTGDKNRLWPVHFYGRVVPYLQIEKLCKLDTLPRPYGFTLSALPVKIDGATAGWCRAVAIFQD